MYLPDHFRDANEAAAFDLIERYPFGMLVASAKGGPDISHVPFLLDRARRSLRAHVARANPIWRGLEDTQPLAIFRGPDAYISPDWYGTDGHVPTWNYAVVHISGPARLLDGRELDSLLESLSGTHERKLSPKPAWTMDKLLPERRARLRRAIVGFELTVETVEAKFKLSQNRTEAERRFLIAAQRAHNTPDSTLLADLTTLTL